MNAFYNEIPMDGVLTSIAVETTSGSKTYHTDIPVEEGDGMRCVGDGFQIERNGEVIQRIKFVDLEGESQTYPSKQLQKHNESVILRHRN